MRAIRAPDSLHRSHCQLLRIHEDSATVLNNMEPKHEDCDEGRISSGKRFLDLAVLTLGFSGWNL